MHLGNAMTALLCWLHTRSANGRFVLRIEDIDGPRSRPEFTGQILEDLRWLGLDWDEGPDTGGPYGPYVQSERLACYTEALDKLQRSGRLYPCYCSRAELAAVASAPHGLASEGPAYAGACRSLSPQEREERTRRKLPSLRFAVPDTPISYMDGIAGLQSFSAGAGGDFVVRRADGILAYQLAVVVDDAAMGITDVLRGGDLLDSTPRQIWLYEALGLPVPRFAHLPMLFGSDGHRLSKRAGLGSLSALRAAGTAAETVVGLLACWSGLVDRAEAMMARELVAAFDLTRIPSGQIIVDTQALQSLLGT
jgi:glutamyl-tRNA synthetase